MKEHSKKFIKFVFVGAVSAAANVGFLYIFVEVFALWYLLASFCSFAVSLVINFALNKVWTFEDRRARGTTGQFGRYMLLAVGNLAVNAFLLSFLVEVLHLWYLAAQIVVIGILAVLNFIAYRLFVFRPKTENSMP